MKPKKFGSAEIASEIAESIKNGTLKLNSRLPSERELAERYSVSRGTIRSALNKLSDDRLVTVRPNAGVFISWQAPINEQIWATEAKPLDLMDARFAIEPHVCRLAALNAQVSDLSELESMLAQMDECKNDHEQFSRIDTRFHMRLVESTGNPVLCSIQDQIASIRKGAAWEKMRHLILNAEVIKTYNKEHRQIVDALRRRTPEEAANFMKQHLSSARNAIVQSYEV